MGALALVAACRGGGSGDPASETSLPLAPFQSSAITLTGQLGTRPTAFTFERLGGQLQLREGRPSGLSLEVQLASAVGSAPALLARLGREDAFQAAARPTASFRATEIEVAGEGSGGTALTLTGDLRLPGGTHHVTLPATLSRTERGLILHLRATVGAPGWDAAFTAPARQIFDRELTLEARLVFPTTPARALAAAGARR
jgi:polyisoprenoid-binding protein YceI